MSNSSIFKRAKFWVLHHCTHKLSQKKSTYTYKGRLGRDLGSQQVLGLEVATSIRISVAD
jgi:hypothetical protein